MGGISVFAAREGHRLTYGEGPEKGDGERQGGTAPSRAYPVEHVSGPGMSASCAAYAHADAPSRDGCRDHSFTHTYLYCRAD